jgi:hypothetical protein
MVLLLLGATGPRAGRQSPEALVVGLGLVLGKRDQPSRHRWVRANVLQGLSFADGLFDFVHQRLLLGGLPLAAWPMVAADLVRVTRPDGWVELSEPPFEIERDDPANERLRGLTAQLTASMGLDSTRVVFDSVDGWLREAGLTRVVRREISVRIGGVVSNACDFHGRRKSRNEARPRTMPASSRASTHCT